MKIVSIIAEFNPFHKGHKYIIETAKKLTGADYCIIITSGNFVQRGEPSFVDKYTKTQVALENGADFVIELPIPFAVSSAMYFSKCAVSLLNRLNIVDYLAFGVENENISDFEEIVDVLIKEPPQYREALKSELSQGFSFPVSRKKALSVLFPEKNLDFLNKPNSILGIEYMKALKELNSSIKPIGIKRINAGYHEEFSTTSRDFNRLFSASNIRTLPLNSAKALLAEISQLYTDNLLTTFPVYLNNSFSSIAGISLLKAARGNNHYFDVPDYLFDKIKNNIYSYSQYSDFISKLKSKEISYTAISRALLHIVLGITDELVTDMIANDYGNYVRVLGIKSGSEQLFKNITANSDITLLTNLKDYKKLLSANAIRYFEHSLFCEDIYSLCRTIDLKTTQTNEFQKKFIRL